MSPGDQLEEMCVYVYLFHYITVTLNNFSGQFYNYNL